MSIDNIETTEECEAFNQIELDKLRKEYAAAYNKLTELGYSASNRESEIVWTCNSTVTATFKLGE